MIAMSKGTVNSTSVPAALARSQRYWANRSLFRETATNNRPVRAPLAPPDTIPKLFQSCADMI